MIVKFQRSRRSRCPMALSIGILIACQGDQIEICLELTRYHRQLRIPCSIVRKFWLEQSTIKRPKSGTDFKDESWFSQLANCLKTIFQQLWSDYLVWGKTLLLKMVFYVYTGIWEGFWRISVAVISSCKYAEETCQRTARGCWWGSLRSQEDIIEGKRSILLARLESRCGNLLCGMYCVCAAKKNPTKQSRAPLVSIKTGAPLEKLA